MSVSPKAGTPHPHPAPLQFPVGEFLRHLTGGNAARVHALAVCDLADATLDLVVEARQEQVRHRSDF